MKSKVIVLITDGANNSGKLSPLDAARLAATRGIKIYTIGVGTPGFHLIRDTDGTIINSGRDEFDADSLREIAQIGGGMFFEAKDTATLERVFQSINDMEKSQVQRRVIVQTEDFFIWCVIPAAILGALHLLWRQTLGRTAPVTA